MESTQTATLSPIPSDGSSETYKVSPTLIPLEEAYERGADIDDVLLLYDSTRKKNFDTNFCRVAEYYGLLCRRLDLRATTLTDISLRDDRGDYFKLVGTAVDAILVESALISDQELGILQAAISEGGANLFVGDIDDHDDHRRLLNLTQGSFLGVSLPDDPVRDWTFSSESPDITREFTGTSIVSDVLEPQGDYALVLNEGALVTVLLSSTDADAQTYHVFARAILGAGSVFLSAAEDRGNIDKLSLRNMYYDTSHFSSIVPLMIATRYVLGDEAWHSTSDYANLTIDDPALTEPFGNLSYIGLLQEMEAHNFHTTIAMPPVSWMESERAVVSLFLAYPNRLSLAQHGNNADGYEFFRYDASGGLEQSGRVLAPRSLSEQEADVIQGLQRMKSHEILTDIPSSPVMVFPSGISPEATLDLLKKHDFLATVNAQDTPLGATRPPDWDYGMYQANMNYANFPTLTRRHPGTYDPFEADIQPFLLDLFIDKPALFYSHEGELFATGTSTFNLVSDQMNNLHGELEWNSLGYILSHIYMEKTNDDSSLDIKMYGNQLIVTNEHSEDRSFHVSKEEDSNLRIRSLTVNGYEFPFLIDDGLLMLHTLVPKGQSMEILIDYEE